LLLEVQWKRNEGGGRMIGDATSRRSESRISSPLSEVMDKSLNVGEDE